MDMSNKVRIKIVGDISLHIGKYNTMICYYSPGMKIQTNEVE